MTCTFMNELNYIVNTLAKKHAKNAIIVNKNTVTLIRKRNVNTYSISKFNILSTYLVDYAKYSN